jgi:Fe-S-cluster containining protein
VLFADVHLEPGDDAEKLRELGLKVSKTGRFKQPCAALNGCNCRIYSERPSYCRKFECLLFGRALRGEIRIEEAHAIIKKARAAVARVEKLLVQLGADDNDLPLRRRFQAQVRKMEAGDIENREAEVFAELTLTFHELNLLLRDEFYR